jgi:hypothetical protein
METPFTSKKRILASTAAAPRQNDCAARDIGKELKLWRSKLLERDRWCFELDGIVCGHAQVF